MISKKTLATAGLATLVTSLSPLAALSPAQAATWQLDTAHTEVGFKVRHMLVTNVRGRFRTFEGTVDFNEKDITKSKVNVTIDVGSIDTDNKKRDDHLRSPDFFDAKKFPKMTFVSTKVRPMGKGKLAVDGKLTIHGITKDVTLEVEGPTQAVKGPYGFTRRGLSARTKISRKEFGLRWNKTIETGGAIVGDEITIVLEVELTQK